MSCASRKSTMDPLSLCTNFILILCCFVCDAALTQGRRELSYVEESMLQEYRMQVARKMTSIETSLDFLRIFVAEDQIHSTFTSMVNKTVQAKYKGRMFDYPVPVQFNQEISDKAMERWVSHGRSVGCSEPAPKLIDMFEEMNLPRWTGYYIYPGCTLVRRCGGSGCCPSELQECVGVPSTRVNVTKPFVKITTTGIDAESAGSQSFQYLNYTLYEDTECACKDRPRTEIPCAPRQCPEKQDFSVALCDCKCRRRCPKPYVQDVDTCACTCAAADRRCLRIKRGKAELQQAQCKCVGHGCENPECKRHWSFSRTLCTCVETAPPANRGRIFNEVSRGSLPEEELQGEPVPGTISMELSSGSPVSLSVTKGEDTTTVEVSKREDGIAEQKSNLYPRIVGGVPFDDAHGESFTSGVQPTPHSEATQMAGGITVLTGEEYRVTEDQGGPQEATTAGDSSPQEDQPQHRASQLGFEDDEDVVIAGDGDTGSGSVPGDD